MCLFSAPVARLRYLPSSSDRDLDCPAAAARRSDGNWAASRSGVDLDRRMAGRNWLICAQPPMLTAQELGVPIRRSASWG